MPGSVWRFQSSFLLADLAVVLEVALVAAEDHVGLVADGVDLELTHPVGDVYETEMGDKVKILKRAFTRLGRL